MRLHDRQTVAGSEIAYPARPQHTVNFGHQPFCIRHMLVDVSADHPLKGLIRACKAETILYAEAEIRPVVVDPGKTKRFFIDVDSHHLAEPVGKKVGDNSRRAADVQ